MSEYGRVGLSERKEDRIEDFGPEDFADEFERHRESEPPRAWKGRRVQIGLIRPGGYDSQTYAPRPLRGAVMSRVIDEVYDNGLVGRFVEDEGDESKQTFYTWGSILFIEPEFFIEPE